MPGHLSTCAKIVFRPALQSPGGSTRELLAQQLLQCAACLLCWDLHLKQMKRLYLSTKIGIRMLNQVVDANLRPTKKLETLSTWRMFHHPCWIPIQKVLKQNKVRLAICATAKSFLQLDPIFNSIPAHAWYISGHLARKRFLNHFRWRLPPNKLVMMSPSRIMSATKTESSDNILPWKTLRRGAKSQVSLDFLHRWRRAPHHRC